MVMEVAKVLLYLYWREDKTHHIRTISFNRNTDEDGTSTFHLMDKETVISHGSPNFITHADLIYNITTNTEYLVSNCLQLKVDVAMYPTALLHKTPSWQDHRTTNQSVCEFTLTNSPNANNYCFGPSFFTHPRGYKLCLVVYAIGYGSGENSHVSVLS